MAKRTQKPLKPRIKPMADPDAIRAIIEKRGGRNGPPPRMGLRIGAALSPAGLVAALIELHNYLNTIGPTDECSTVRRWLFNYVGMYRAQLAMEDDSPKLAFRTPFIEASDPFTEGERRSVAEALALKKQIDMQVRALRARNIWW